MKKILLIDDDKDLSETIKSVLEYAGYDVALSPEGQNGIAKAKELRPNLILLDIMMPGMNGAEAMSKLKEESATCHIPVIFLTGLAVNDDDNIKVGINVGGEKIQAIAKPFENEKLLKIIRETIGD